MKQLISIDFQIIYKTGLINLFWRNHMIMRVIYALFRAVSPGKDCVAIGFGIADIEAQVNLKKLGSN